MSYLPYNKIYAGLDISRLHDFLLTNPDCFGKYDLRKGSEGSVHYEMDDIWARYANPDHGEKTGDWTYFAEEHDSEWYPIADELPDVKRLCFEVMGLVDGERLGGVLITRLPPGGRILEHVDSGWHATYYDKYFVPIANKTGATFGFKEGVIAPDEGDVWGFDNFYPHWVDNDTDDVRIAMIVCIKQNKFDRGGH